MLHIYSLFYYILLGKRRRQTADFPGAKKILEEIKNKPARKRVGFLSKGPPARGKYGGIIPVLKYSKADKNVFYHNYDLQLILS